MKKITFYTLLIGLLFSACEPALEEKIDIGTPPSSSFSFDFIDLNNVKFNNTTTDEHFMISWDFGAQGVYSDEEVEINFPRAGTFDVKLTVFGKGGSTTKTETITITQDDPTACDAITMFLTGCGERVWKLNPDAGALWVGPDANSSWWFNTASDVTDRDCDWNDRYTFKSDGKFDYAANGDLWGEDYTGFDPAACYPITDLAANLAAWGDGNHTYEIIPATATDPAKLKVIGLGAFLGLRKAANGAEISAPISDITYDILEMTVGTPNILHIEVNFGGGLWRFKLASE